MAVDYKIKYIDLRSKFLEGTDTAYRLGYADGLKEGQMQAMQQQMQQQQQMEAQMAAQAQGQMPPGAEGGEMPMPPGAEGEMPPEEAQMPPGAEGEEPMGEEASELDNHIDELSQLVAKGEKPSIKEMRNVVSKLADLRKAQKSKYTKYSTKEASAQKKLVNSILKKWENESKNVTEGLEEIIKENGLQIEE